jgi:hypothetical protein
VYVPNGVSQKIMVDTEDAYFGETTFACTLINLIPSQFLFLFFAPQEKHCDHNDEFLFVVTMITECVVKVTEVKCTYMAS